MNSNIGGIDTIPKGCRWDKLLGFGEVRCIKRFESRWTLSTKKGFVPRY